MRDMEISYRYKNSISGMVHKCTMPVLGRDPEYEWRMSPLNVPHTVFLGAKEIVRPLATSSDTKGDYAHDS